MQIEEYLNARACRNVKELLTKGRTGLFEPAPLVDYVPCDGVTVRYIWDRNLISCIWGDDEPAVGCYTETTYTLEDGSAYVTHEIDIANGILMEVTVMHEFCHYLLNSVNDPRWRDLCETLY
jgi:hypothetical protein